MPEEKKRKRGRFRCLRCGTEFELDYTPGTVEERSCPECESNSVRRLKEPEPKQDD
jgi:DNA-directed RNA polymerase subunit RPC12/RpoP